MDENKTDEKTNDIEYIKPFPGSIRIHDRNIKRKIEKMHKLYCEANFQNKKSYTYTQYMYACMLCVDTIIKKEQNDINKQNKSQK